MSGILLDTNVVSELVRNPPNANVERYVLGLSDGWLSSVTIHELIFGVERLRDGTRKSRLDLAISTFLGGYADRIIAIGADEARQAGVVRGAVTRAGRTMAMADALIAACAHLHDLTLATRNIKDFADCGLDLVNPWEV